MEMEKKALNTGPLLHVLSIKLKSNMILPKKVYGWITVEHFISTYGEDHVHYLYHRLANEAEVLDTDGTLTLNGPKKFSNPQSTFIPMFMNEINVELYDEDGNQLVDRPIVLDDTNIEGGYEQVKSKCFRGMQEHLYLVVDYLEIPFGYCAGLFIYFCSTKHNSVNVDGKHNNINVNGKIVASLVNTYGGYTFQECVLFKKDPNAFETVEINGAHMLLSRCWLAFPAYSSLVIRVDLSEKDTGRKIVEGSIPLLPDIGIHRGGQIYLDDDSYMEVGVRWFKPAPLGRYDGKLPIDHLPIKEETDTQEDDELGLPQRKMLRDKLFPSPAIEIFSIFVGRKESKAVNLHGSIEVWSEGKRVCYVFNREKNDPLFLSQHMMTAPVLKDVSSRFHGDLDDLEIKFNMKDIGGNVVVKGYEKWDGEILEHHYLYRNKQLCCLIQGEQGFVALHYSIFSRAVFACPKIFLNLKTPSSDVYPKVYGSLTCEYRYHFYSSKYHKDYYGIVLFTKTQGDAVELDGEGLLPLCRSLVVVPSYSPLIINLELELECGLRRFQKVASSVMEFGIGDKSKTEDKSDITIRIEVDWSEIH